MLVGSLDFQYLAMLFVQLLLVLEDRTAGAFVSGAGPTGFTFEHQLDLLLPSSFYLRHFI